MIDIFLKLANISIQASVLMLLVIILRMMLKKTPKWMVCLLWALVAIRLICPVSIESSYSLAPKVSVINNDSSTSKITIESGISAIDRSINQFMDRQYAGETEVTKSLDGEYLLQMFPYIWILGIVCIISYAVINYIKIRRQVRESIRLQEQIYLCDTIPGPFVLGIVSPKIYLPSSIQENQVESVVKHEKVHIKRLDHIWKVLGFGLLAVYWFQPMCWISYILLCRDIELACDEQVIKEMGGAAKKIMRMFYCHLVSHEEM